MKKKIVYVAVIIIMSFVLPLTLFSQETKTTLQMLKATKWSPKANCNYSSGRVYLNDSIIDTFSFGTTVTPIVFKYYLSDSIVSSFDHNKIGKIENGNYIITFNLINHNISIFKIVQLTDSFLELKDQANNLVTLFEAKSLQ